MCPHKKMGKAGANSQFDLADPMTVGLMVIGAAGSNAVVNPIINAIYKQGSGKTAPKILKPALKVGLGYLALMKSNNFELEAIGAGAMLAGGVEAVVNMLPPAMRLQLGIPETVGANGEPEVFELAMPMQVIRQNQTVSGAATEVY